MTLSQERMQELAALYAIGALEGEELDGLQQGLRDKDHELVKTVAAMNNVAAALGTAAEVQVPAPHVKEKLMKKIGERTAGHRSNPSCEHHAPGIFTVFPERMDWTPHAVPGVNIKVLSENYRRGYVTMLMKVDPGTMFPEHHHSGEEECYILSGSIIINGRRLGPGVLHHGNENSDHATLTSDEGALLLLVVSSEDYLGA